MSETIFVAILSCIGTAAGSIVSILTANRLTNYKIEVVQKEMEELKDETKKHNEVIARTFKLEEKTSVLDEKIRTANHRIDDLESEAKKKR